MLAITVALSLCFGVPRVTAANTWATGEALEQRLSQHINIVWSDTPLHQALENLARSQGVAIVLDRRVDGSRRIGLSINDLPLQTAIEDLARQVKLEVVRIGPVMYLGPPEAASQLRVLTPLKQNFVRRLPSPAMRKFQHAQEMAWDDLAEPRAILEAMGSENDFSIDALDSVPHDLWPAAELPPMALVDRLTLIVGQFGLSFEITPDGKKVILTSIPKDIQKYKRPSSSVSNSRRPRQPARPSKNRPNAEDSPRATEPPATSPSESADPNDVGLVHIEHLAVQEKPLGPVLRQLADRLQLDLRIDEKAIAAAGVSLDQRVSLTADDASVDEILEDLLQNTGLTFRRTQRTVEVVPAQ